MIDPTGMEADGWRKNLTNGEMSYDDSYTFENTPEGFEYGDAFITPDRLYNSDGSTSAPLSLDDPVSCIECHHTAVVPNGKKIDLTGNFGGLYINGIGGYNMGGNKIEGDPTTINYDDISLFGAGGAQVKGVLKSIQYLSSSFGAFSSLTASDQESVINYSEGLKKDSVYTIQGTETGQGFYRSEVSNKAAADRVKNQYEKQGLNNVTVHGKEKKKWKQKE